MKGFRCKNEKVGSERRVEILYVEEPLSAKKIGEILSDGVYCYLKKNNLLKEDSEQGQRIRDLLAKAEELDAQIDEAELETFLENT
jgi:hypothetical protein